MENDDLSGSTKGGERDLKNVNGNKMETERKGGNSMNRKWLTALLAVALVFCAVFGLMGTSARAASGTITLSSVSGSENLSFAYSGDNSGVASVNGDIITLTETGGTLLSKTNTLTITNNVDAEVKICFSVLSMENCNSFTIAGNDGALTTYEHTFSAKGDTLTIAINAARQTTASAEIQITSITVNKSVTVTLTAPEAGSYTASSGSVTPVTMTANSADTSFTYMAVDGLKLVASAPSGQKFHYWSVGDEILNGIWSTYTSYDLDGGETIGVQFTDQDTPLIYGVGNSRYPSWNEAVTAAKSDEDGVITIVSDYKIPSQVSDDTSEILGDYVQADADGNLTYYLPSDVKLLIPKKNEDRGTFNESVETASAGALTAPTSYCTLTVASGAKLDISGQICVNGTIVAYQTTKQNTPTGLSGYIYMEDGSLMTLQSGAKLFCYGYIYGSGWINATSGAEVYELLQMMDWFGGTNGTAWALVNKLYEAKKNYFFCTSQYYYQNVEAPIQFDYNSHSYVVANILISDAYTGYNIVEMLGPSGALFNLTSGYMTRVYDGSTDRNSFNVYGDLSTSTISMTVGTTTIESKNYVLALNGNMSMNLMSGTTKLNNKFALIPGTKVYVGQDATLEVSSGTKLFVFDRLDWDRESPNGFVFVGNGVSANLTPIYYTATNGSTPKRTANTCSGQIEVDGTLIGYGNIYITEDDNVSLDKILIGDGKFVNNSAGADDTARPLNCSGSTIGSTDVACVPLSGQFVDVDYTNASTKYTIFDAGTYYGLSDTDTWYQYNITLNYQDAEGNTALESDEYYITGTEFSFDALTLGDANGNGAVDSGEKRYCFTTCATSGDATVTGKPNSDVSSGWTSLSLADISDDVEITLTVAEYDYAVNWTDNTNGDATWTDFVTGSTLSLKKDSIWALDAAVTNLSGESSPVNQTFAYDETTENGSTTLTLSNITEDINVTLTGSSDTYKVTWNLTGAVEDTVVRYAQKGGDLTYTLAQPEDGWYVIESNYTVSGTAGVTASSESITLTGIGSEVTVTLKITKYNYKVLLTTGQAFYTNDTSVIIKASDLNQGKCIFSSASASPDTATTTLSTYCEELTVGNLKERLTTVSVGLTAYNYVVQFQNGETLLDKHFITGTSTSYTVETGQFVESATANTSAAVAITQATETDGAVINVSAITEDTVITLSTYAFDKIITFVDSDDKELAKEYTTATKYTYECEDRYRVTAASTTAGTLSAVGGESITVSALSGSATVTLTLDHFDYKVTWKDNDSSVTLQVDYLDSPDDTATYQVTDEKVIAAVKSHGNDVTITDENGRTNGNAAGRTLTVSGMSAANADRTISISSEAYTYMVEFTDGTDVLATKYAAKDDSGEWCDVTDSSAISYSCGKGKYITAYSGTEDETLVLTPDASDYDKQDGYDSIQLATLTGDRTVALTLADYQYKVTWIVKSGDRNNDGAVTTYKYLQYVNADSASYPLDNGYVVTSISSGDDSCVGEATATVSGLTANTAVTVDARNYSYKVTWNITVNTENGQQSTSNDVYLDIGESSASYAFDGDFTIRTLEATSGTASGLTTNTATVSDITEDVTVNLLVQDYDYIVTWNVNGEETQTYVKGNSAKWEMPTSTDGKTYVVVEAVTSVGTGEVTHTNKTVTVKPESDVTVKITTEEALTNYKALWGDMSFKYYKNGSYYAKGEDGYTWTLMDQYAWTHKTGSVIHTYADLNTLDLLTYYTVPNGSVMIVNPTNQKIEATITIELDDTNWVVAPTVTLTAEDEKETTGVTTITVTLDAHSTLLINSQLEGTPNMDLTDEVTGSCAVVIKPID